MMIRDSVSSTTHSIIHLIAFERVYKKNIVHAAEHFFARTPLAKQPLLGILEETHTNYKQAGTYYYAVNTNACKSLTCIRVRTKTQESL